MPVPVLPAPSARLAGRGSAVAQLLHSPLPEPIFGPRGLVPLLRHPAASPRRDGRWAIQSFFPMIDITCNALIWQGMTSPT